MMKFLVILCFLSSNLAWAGYSPFGDLHWKGPVTNVAALPASGNLPGDTRIELTSFGEYVWTGSAWTNIAAGGSGTPGGADTDVQFNSAGSFGGSSSLTWSGTVLAVTGAVSASNLTDSALTSGLPVLSTAPFSTGTLSGNTTEFATATGSLTSGHGVKIDASGNLIDSGAVPATVTSVGLSAPAEFTVSGSPVTSSGTLSFTKASESANTFWSAPNGSAGAPTFRLIAAADLPAFGGATSGSSGTKGAVPAPSSGQQNDCLLGSGSWGTCGAGSVTSVGLSDGSTAPIYSISGSPVTGSGTLTFTLASQTANKVFAAPNGSTGQPAFRLLVGSDLPTPTLTTLGGIESLTCSAGQAISGIDTSGVPSCASVGASYTASDSIALSGTNFTLVNDSATPSSNNVYGTNGSGTLGWEQLNYNQLAGSPVIPVQGQSEGSSHNAQTVVAPYNQVTNSASNTYLIETGNKNLLPNASFENATATTSWTTTKLSGTTFTSAVDTTNFTDGKQSLLGTLTAATGEISQDVTPNVQTNGVPMVAACRVNTSATDVQVCARAGATDISCTTVASAGSWVLQPVNFTGPANGTSVGVSVKNTVSGSESFNVDDCYVGVASTPQNFGPVSQSVFFGGVTWPATASCFWRTTTSASFASFAAVSACTLPSGTGIEGNASAPATKIPAITLNNVEPGAKYHFIATGNFGSVGSTAGCSFRFTDGTVSTQPEIISVNGIQVGGPVIQGDLTFTSGGAHTVEIQTTGAFSSVNCQVEDSTATTESLRIVAYQYPASSEIAYRPDVLPASYSGTLVGSGGGWTTASGTYADFAVATTSTTLTNISANNITCSAESTKLPAITCTLPKAGAYWVCAGLSSRSGTANTDYFSRLVDGSSNVINGGMDASNASGNNAPFQLCGAENIASVTSAITFKVQGKTAGGTETITQLSDAPITWSITALNQSMPAPLLMGSVTSSSTGQEHIERATISSTGSIVSESGSWISGTPTHSTGTYGITAVSGEWSATPTCVCSTGAGYTTGNAVYACVVLPNSSTSISVFTGQATASVDRQFDIICMGPR